MVVSGVWIYTSTCQLITIISYSDILIISINYHPATDYLVNFDSISTILILNWVLNINHPLIICICFLYQSYSCKPPPTQPTINVWKLQLHCNDIFKAEFPVFRERLVCYVNKKTTSSFIYAIICSMVY